MGWLWSQLECGVTATGALDASCSHVLPVYKMHTKGPSDFKDKNILGARVVLSEEVYVQGLGLLLSKPSVDNIYLISGRDLWSF